MGWTDTHLHQFAIRGKQYWIPDEGDMALRKKIDERKHRLKDVVSRQTSRFTYEYDFGDLWAHELLVENILSPQAGVRYPVCLAGARTCPPEDVGGRVGYENLLEAIHNPNHPQHEGYLEWIGEGIRCGGGQSEATPAEVIREKRTAPERKTSSFSLLVFSSQWQSSGRN